MTLAVPTLLDNLISSDPRIFFTPAFPPLEILIMLLAQFSIKLPFLKGFLITILLLFEKSV